MKSIYEMTQEELKDFTPTSFKEAFMKDAEPLVEEWSKTPYLEHGPAIPGKTPQERDTNKAIYARLLQNYVDLAFPPTRTRDGTKYTTVSEAMDYCKKHIPSGLSIYEAAQNEGKIEGKSQKEWLAEAASAAQTSAWSGATTLPLVLGYARKIMPKLYGMQFYQTQPLDRPTGRVFFIVRNRDNNGTTDGQVAQRAGWSYRSWITDPGENTAITRAVTFTITSSDVTAKTRKLQAQTTVEVEQDLRAYFGMDAVALVSDIATDEMALEIDEELIYGLYNHAVANGCGQFQYGAGVPSSMTQEAYDKRVIEILNRASYAVWHQKRVIPNWAILGTEWATLLTNLSLWRTNTEELTFTSFVMPGDRLPINGNPSGYTAAKPWPTTDAILGHKGTDYVDGTAFYLPYLPLQLFGILKDPNTMHTTLSWLTRYTTYFHKFTGQNESFAWLTQGSSSITGLSYPAPVEYV